MNSPALLGDHLWQSTIFAAVAMLLSLVLRKNRAQLRYWIWLAASVKFLVPFSLLVSIGGRLDWRTEAVVPPATSLAIEQISQPFTMTPITGPVSPAGAPILPVILAAIWLAGFAIVLSVWLARWWRLRAEVRRATALPLAAPIPVLTLTSRMEPGLFGIVRPVLLLPQGIAERLSPAQLSAILAHELCHLRRRDNLAAAAHMVVEALFWFHPLVWWIGARLVEERERACDEEVLRMGNQAQAYAEGILSVCKFYLQSPLPCASGVSGADLKKRIGAIMTNRVGRRLTFARKLLLAAAGVAAVAAPILIGLLNASRVRAQSEPPGLAFEVASIKPSDPNANRVSLGFMPGGGLNVIGGNLRMLISFAYDIPCGKNCNGRILGGPAWIDSATFDIIAKAPPSASPPVTDLTQVSAAQRKVINDQVRARLRALLADRFQLAVRRETREMPVYELVVVKSGSKLKPSSRTDGNSTSSGGRGQLICENVTIPHFLVNLTGAAGRPVIDRTGLTGRYDFTLEYAPESLGGGGKGPGDSSPPADISGPSIFTALQEQLGLKLETARGPVEVIVIERAEKPTEN